jgi:hypothetical protein
MNSWWRTARRPFLQKREKARSSESGRYNCEDTGRSRVTKTQHKRTQAADLKRHCEHSFLPRLIETLEVEGIARWPYRQRWGYYPSGGLGLVVLILVILLLLGRI